VEVAPPTISTLPSARSVAVCCSRAVADTGAKVMIETNNPKALKAVHDFLRFQIAEHQTGDPTEVANDTQHQ
jgi:enoyl-[acyl-carrier-protein] reductase (NADH)